MSSAISKNHVIANVAAQASYFNQWRNGNETEKMKWNSAGLNEWKRQSAINIMYRSNMKANVIMAAWQWRISQWQPVAIQAKYSMANENNVSYLNGVAIWKLMCESLKLKTQKPSNNARRRVYQSRPGCCCRRPVLSGMVSDLYNVRPASAAMKKAISFISWLASIGYSVAWLASIISREAAKSVSQCLFILSQPKLFLSPSEESYSVYWPSSAEKLEAWN